MEESRIVEIKEDILADNTNAANDFRKMLENQSTFFVDVMASPGAGKTTLLLALIEELRKSASIGIIEADLESFVDSRKIKTAFRLPISREHRQPGLPGRVRHRCAQTRHAAFGSRRV